MREEQGWMRERLRKGWHKYGLELLLLVLCGILFTVGISHKEGYHMDELLSFELSNARFNPWIVPTQPQGRLDKFVEQEIEGEQLGETLGNLWDTVWDVVQNRGNSKLLSYQADVYEEPVWISGEDFTDYITVQEKDAFQYLSVYFNVKDDNHPPLHFMALHTISSLLRGQAEPFMGCFINLVAVLGTIWLLMALGRSIAGQWFGEEYARMLGLVAGGIYGISAGAMATVLLIRMYAMLTFFCVALCYLHWRKWREQGFGKHNKLLILVTVLGFLTQYFFLFYCLLLAAVTAVLLWRRKRLAELWRYVRSMVIAAVIGLVCFPFAISDVFSSGRGVEALENLTEGFAGYGSRLLAFGGILAERTLPGYLWALLLGLAVILLFLSRKQAKGRRFPSEQAGTSSEQSQVASPSNTTAGPIPWAELSLLVLPVVGNFLLAARMSPYLVDRYIMPVFPFAALLMSLGLGALLYGLEQVGYFNPRDLWKLGLVVVLVQGLKIGQYDGSYLYEGYTAQEVIAEHYAEEACICVYDGVGYYENLKEFTHYNQTLLVTLEELETRQEQDSIRELDQVVVLLKQNVDAEAVFDILASNYGMIFEEDLCADLRESVYGDRIWLFGKEGGAHD